MYTKLRSMPLLGLALSTAFMLTVAGCKKEDENNMTVTSAMSGTKNLSGASKATNVSVTDNVVITFSKDVDPATVTAASVNLKPTTAGSTAQAANLTVSGMTVTIDPIGDLMTGNDYNLNIANTVKGKDGASFAAKTFVFRTAGRPAVTPPQVARQKAYWGFNGTANDASGTFSTNYAKNTWGKDRYDSANSAAMFNGLDDIIEIANGKALIAPSMTISYWMMVDTTSGHNLSPMGIGMASIMQIEVDGKANNFKNAARFTLANGTTATEDLWFNGEGASASNGGWQGWVFNTDLRPTGGLKSKLAMKWVHIVYTYTAATKERTWYMNGEKMMTADFDAWPAGDAKQTVTGHGTIDSPEIENVFAFGFAKSRGSTINDNEPWGNFTSPTALHFKGGLDDVRFFDVALTAAEATALYNAEKKP